MRRILKCLLAALWIIMVLLLPAAQADDGTAWIEEPCTVGEGGIHKDNWERVQIGTCIDDDIEIYSCSYCGKSHTYIYPAPGHQWDEGKVTKEPTCTEAGERTYTCTRLIVNAACGEKRTESIPALGHDPETISGKAATCTENGLTDGSRCRRCGEIIKAQETISALGHNWDSGTVTTAASCTQEGVKTFTCANCGATYTESIPKTGHTPETIPAVAATCEQPGKTEGSKCSVCGEILTAQKDIAAIGHNWDSGTVTTAASCTQEGVKTFTCANCGATYTESIPKTGHTPETIPAVAATCEQPGKTEGSKCSVCGEILTAQKDIAAIGHEWGEWQAGKEPTCEEKGRDYSVCKNCRQTKYRDNIEPLGHDWDEGKLTKEAGYLEAGEITYTCKRDASHIKKEVIPMKELAEGYTSVMSLMRNNPPGAGSAQKLAIFRQPEGGVIDGGGFELSVEAMGGVEPYSYEWRVVTGQANMEQFSSGADPTASSLLSHRWRLAGKVCERITGRNATAAGAGKKLSSADFGYDSIPRDNTASYYDRSEICTPEFFVGARVGEDAPTIIATSAGIYYCIVRDSTGDYVSSEKVQVNDLLYIVQQPMNLNLMGQDSVTLTCKAAGGMPFADGSYMYMWCNEKGSDIKTGSENWIEVSEEGEYYCLVQDNYGDPITSDRATVYRAEPLTVTCDQNVYYLLPGEEPVTIGMTIGGGVPPYEVRWATNLGTIDTFTTEETYLTKQVSDYGTYGLAVKDSMGKFNAAPCDVKYKQLQIAQQPVDGVLRSDENTPYTVSIVMAEGEAPFTYTLVKDDTNTNLATGEGDASYSFDIWETGTHHIHVEDAAGRWADSSLFYVDDYCFRIYTIEKSGDLTGPDDAVTLTALLESAEEDVTYRWWWMGSMEAQVGAIELPENGPVCIATRPGQYQCLATNRNGLDSTATVRVAYLGSEPIILQQPQSVALQYEEGKTLYPAALSVSAISSDNRTDVLEYVWEYEVNGLNGTWLPGEQGSNELDLRLSDGKEVAYRCKVTDRRTGAYVISDEAHAFIELNVSINIWHDLYSSNACHVGYDIQGGASPYRIELYRHQVVGIDDNGGYIYSDFNLTATISYDGDGDFISEDRDLVFRYKNGQYIRVEPWAQYYFVVIDSNGKTKTSETAQVSK